MNPRKVVFLDRDGVINRDSRDHIKGWREFEFLPGSLEALRLLNAEGFSVVVVTNQSAVGRKMITAEDLEDMHRRMRQKIVEAGGGILDVFYCPHMPDEGCNCRKPKTGMLARAVGRYGIDLSTAVMVGDSAKDVLCARGAAVGRAVLVLTGNGRSAERELSALDAPPDHVAADLLAAARWISAPKPQCEGPRPGKAHERK